MGSTLRSQSTGLLPSDSIAAAAAQSRDLLLQCTNIPTLMQLEWAENRLAEFKMWAATTGALANDAASLDARLITEPNTKDLVKGLLVLLTQCLGKCKKSALASDEETEEATEEFDEADTASEGDDEWWANDVQELDSPQGHDAARDIPRGFSPWSDDSSSNPGSGTRSMAEDTSPLLEAEAEVEQIINHLARVALAIRKSGTSSRLHKADRTFDPSKHQNFRRHLELIILARGREDGSSDYHIDTEALTTIQERLILANLRRRNRYRYAQKHADKLAVDSTSTNYAGEKSAAVNVLTLRQHDSTIMAPATAKSEREQAPGQDKYRLPHRDLVLTATTASGVAQTIEAVPERELTPSRVAKTNITTTAAKVLYPKPPQSKILEYFKCPCCSQTLPDVYRETTLWKKHMMADICPYICILEDCPMPEKLYVTRHEWVVHIEKNHRQCWQCPACSVLGSPPVIFPSIEIFLHHLRETHSPSINEEQYSTIVTEAARPIPPGICRCPLCDSTGPADSPDLLDHIAEHLHNFALRSLPWPNNGPGDNEAGDPGDPYFNADDYFDQESDNDSVQDVCIDSDRDLDDLAPLSVKSSHDDSDHDLPMEVSPTNSEETQRMDQMRRWLSPVDPSSSLAAARAQRHEGTGAWFLKGSPFSKWQRGEIGILCLDGHPGSGKTILSTTVFDHLENSRPRCTLAFIFDFMDIGKQTFESLLRSLAWQLYRFVAASRVELERLHRACLNGAAQPGVSRLSVCVKSMVKSSSSERLSVIIDALDECTTQHDLLSWLEMVVSTSSPDNIKFILTGQRLSDLLDGFAGTNAHIVSFNRYAASYDIRSYVDARLKQDTDFTMKEIPQDLLQEICTTLVDGANGIFLWAVMQLDSLATCQSLAAMRAFLQTLPRDLIGTYSGILRRLPPNDKSDAIRLLQFLAYTNQPLTSSEAIEIIATQIDTDTPYFNIEKRLMSSEDLLQYCPSLLSLESHLPHRRDLRKVRLSNSMVKEFLLRDLDQFRLKSAGIAITRTVLTYLSLLNDIDVKVTLKETSARFPLAERAATMLLGFARYADTDDDVFSEIMAFIRHPVALDRCCWLLHMSTEDHRVSPLFFACKAGLLRVTRRLLEDGVDVNEESGTQLSLLVAASQEGHVDVVRLLLGNRTDVSAESDMYSIPLQAASEHGHLDVVELWLNMGANPNTGHSHSRAPLQLASKNGHQDIVQFLLGCGADCNAYNEEADSPLMLALSSGNSELAELLLRSGARASDNTLHEASRNGDVVLVELLLDKDIELLDHQSYTNNAALRAALEGGHSKVVEILRSHTLCQAVIAGDYHAVEGLLDDGVSPDGDSCLGTPLEIAAKYRSLSIVKILLERGANVSKAANGNDLVAYYENFGLETTDEILNLLRQHRSSGPVLR